MVRSFLIKYAEIGVKGKNRYIFEDKLTSHIHHSLKRLDGDFSVIKESGRIYAHASSEFDYDEVVSALQCVFGIAGICPMVQIEDNGYFILPGGTPVAAQLQFARTVAPRAERRLWTLHKQDALPEIILQFINRLSDLFFVMARYEMQQQNWTEEKWQSFAYKRKSAISSSQPRTDKQ